MNKSHTTVISVAFILLALGLCLPCFYTKKLLNRQNHVQELLQKMSFEQKWFFSHLCTECITESTMGYTLFGDKPISNTPLRGQTINRRCFFRTVALPLIRKYENMLQSTNFVLLLEETSTDALLYLINKKAFRHAVHQNIAIFRSILGKTITPDDLLTTIISKKCTIETALQENHILFGILFGFGTDNSVRFARRQQLEDEINQLSIPPWKDPRTCGTMNIEDWTLLHVNTKNGTESATTRKTTSRRSFSSTQEELIQLNKKLSFVCSNKCPPGHLLRIELPGFMGDLDSEETRNILEKYSIQRTVLTQLLEEENVLQKVIETFYKNL